MNLTLPEVSKALSPTWATQINTALTSVDSHDHTSASGQRLTTAGININEDLSISSNKLTTLNSTKGQNRAAVSTTNNSFFVVSGEFYFRDNSGNDAQITQGGSVNVSGFGGIDGDYSSTLASMYYTDSIKKYQLDNSDSVASDIVIKDLTCTTVATANVTTGSLSSPETNLTSLASGGLAASNTVALNGNNTGRGIIPVGAVMALATNLTGVSVTTGYALMDGSTISDTGSPMDGVVLPNINNSVFLTGASAAGTTGGANSITLIEANLPSHLHTINHGHSDTFALVNPTGQTASHTHTMPHTHIWQQVQEDSASGFHSWGNTLDASDTASTTIAVSDSNFIQETTTIVQTNGGPVNNTAFLYDFALDDNDQMHTTGVIGAPTGSGSTAVTGSSVESTTTTISGSVTSSTDNSGSNGSGGAIDNKPNYISTQFIIRIK